MNNTTRVGVSRETYHSVNGSLSHEIELVPFDGFNGRVTVLWRRQGDRTAWAASAIAGLPRLRWLHTDTVGIDRLPLDVLAERRILLSNARGAYTPAVSEWALGAILLAAKNFHRTVHESDQRAWTVHTNNIQLRGRRIVILGLGSIGAALAKACATLGMHVLGVSRTGSPTQGVVRVLRASDDWPEEFASATFLVNCLPLTPETEGLIDKHVLSLVAPGAWFVNVGRGETVNEAHLAAAVRSGRFRGAILDCIANEPLTPASTLWGCPNIIVSPHASSLTDQAELRSRELFLSELDRYRNGTSPMNLVDIEKGY